MKVTAISGLMKIQQLISERFVYFTKEKTITHFNSGSFLKIVPQQNKTKIQVIYGSQKAA